MVRATEPVKPAVASEYEPCEAIELPDGPRDRGDTLEVLIQTATTERDAACLVRVLEQSLPGLAAQSPPPPSLAELRQWWEIVGSRSQRYEFGPSDLVVLPEMPRPLRERRRAAFEPLLCAPPDNDCGAESRAFLAAAEQQLWALSELQRIERTKKEAEENEQRSEETCAREALAEGSYDTWESCVRRLIPTRLVAPREAFRVPERGILRTHLSGYWKPCLETKAYALKSATVLTRIDCWLRASKERVIRYRFERVDPKAVQQAALFVAISKELQKSPEYGRSFAIPSGLTERHTHSVSAPGRIVSDALTLSYELHGVLAAVPADRLYVHHETEPERRFIVHLLRGLDEASAPSCATSADKADLTELFGHLAKPEENLEQTLESVACPR